MRWHPYSTSIGIVVIGLASLVATGCVDGRGFPLETEPGASDAAAGRGGQAGFTSSSGGTAGTKGAGGAVGTGGVVQSGGAVGGATPGGAAGTKGTAGTAGASGMGGTAGSVDAGGVAGSKGTGGVTGFGGAIGSGGSKGGSSGSADAAADVSTSDGAGRVDRASDAGARDALAPEARAAPDSSVAADARVLCGPVCDIYCAYGNVLDANGCPTCNCNPVPTVCPAIKCKACPFGFLPDASGCQTCSCAPDPGLPCNQYLDPTSCGGSTDCRWLDPGCASSGGTPALAAAGCYDQAAVGCTTSNDCSDGRSCIQRTIDPCAGVTLTCFVCASTVGICL